LPWTLPTTRNFPLSSQALTEVRLKCRKSAHAHGRRMNFVVGGQYIKSSARVLMSMQKTKSELIKASKCKCIFEIIKAILTGLDEKMWRKSWQHYK